MAPEQAKGRPADRRSDIWAFGCVLYEMLTGTRAFEGEDVSDTMASLLTREPSWDRLPGTTPPAVRLLLQRCLRKEKRQRLQDATGVRIELEDAANAPVGSASALLEGGRATSWRTVLVAGVGLLGSAVVAGLAVWNLKASPVATPQTIARLTVTVPSDEELLVPYRGVAAVSQRCAPGVRREASRSPATAAARDGPFAEQSSFGHRRCSCAVLLTRRSMGGFLR